MVNPQPFEEFVEHALYDPETGFYAAHGQAGGRRGDFITSVEVGPLFAAVIADWLDARWRDLGEPAEFRVAEAAAGRGTLWRGIQRAKPACLHALSYTVVERSAALRAEHEAGWQSASELPPQHQHVIVANELLDNLAFGIAERVGGGWASVGVVETSDGELGFHVGPADPELAYLSELAPQAELGSRVPVATHARAWVEQSLERADQLLIFDYGASTAELAVRGQAGWLRTYAGHERGSEPLRNVGRCDITHDVPTDQLPAPTTQRTQAEWLAAHGIDERVAQAREIWAERAAIGDLAAMVARSAINESAALTDPTGLGSFLVLEWRV